METGFTGSAGRPGAARYDGASIVFHWLTALLVIALFVLALVFNGLPRGTPMRHSLQLVHVSLGIGLAAVFILRIVWAAAGRAARPAHPGAAGVLAQAGHGLLYLMLGAQVVLGFLYRWAQGEEFTFFGLFPIPAPFAPNRPWARSFDTLHYWLAWAIIVVAAGHALLALFHQLVLRDGTLRRMVPGARGHTGGTGA